MIVATAGHIDHGKTALVRALTGTDTDRLPEEKRRGITVDLGFAYRRRPGAPTLSFVDVPGHEKLVRTMLAGAIGVDFVMLVVAADDGIMPQTREHLAILDLLALGRGVAVITKIDSVSLERVATVAAAVAALLADTSLAGIPVLPVSAQRGDGLDALDAVLDAAAAAIGHRDAGGAFRLAVDRAFIVAGAGLVVTGTVQAGRVEPGDRLVLSRTGAGPGSDGPEVRVRGLHAANAVATTGASGERCALNITGARVDKASVSRGDWLVAPGLAARSARLDVGLRLLAGEPRPLRHWTPVHVHLGSADLPGRVALLEGASLDPGTRALAQLVLDQPIAALAGDRFVLRDQSARRTIGGGRVIDPDPPLRNTRKPERLAALHAQDGGDHAAALAALLPLSPTGVDLNRFARIRNIERSARDCLVEASGAVIVTVAGRDHLFAPERWAAISDDACEAVEAFARLHPDKTGATAGELLRTFPLPLRPVVGAALERTVSDGSVARFGQLFHPPGHAVTLTVGEDERWTRIATVMAGAGSDPLRLALLAERVCETEEDLVPLLEKVARMGLLRRASRVYFLLPGIAADLAGACEACAVDHQDRLLTVGRFRELTGISRHATMPVLEFFDRVGLTTRHPDGRRLRTPAASIFAGAAEASSGSVKPAEVCRA